MLTLEYKLDGTAKQYSALDAGIRVGQFIRNKCIRVWVDKTDEGKSFAAMRAYTAVLATEFDFARLARLPGPSGECRASLACSATVL